MNRRNQDPQPGQKQQRGEQQELEQAAEERPPSLLAEFSEFLRHNKKWWLLPIVLVLLAFSVLVILSGTGAAPFIYTFH
jgi:hypothetical protein